MVRVLADPQGLMLLFDEEGDIDVMLKMLTTLKKFKKNEDQSYPAVASIWSDHTDENYKAAVLQALRQMPVKGVDYGHKKLSGLPDV